MNLPLLFVIIGYEAISAWLIYRLWHRKRPLPVWERCVLTLVLLVPLAGWVMYIFLGPTSDADPTKTDRFGVDAGCIGSDGRHGDH